MASRYFVLIPCAGIGSRSGLAIPKQYQPILGKRLLYYSLHAFHQSALFKDIFLVLAPDDPYFQMEDYEGLNFQVEKCGGKTRQESVLNGLKHLKTQGVKEDDWVLVHDAARPGITVTLIQSLVQQIQSDAVGGILALPVADTLKRVKEQRIVETTSREALWQAQTPQMFRLGLLEQAILRAQQDGFAMTDEASAIEYLGLQPKIVQGDLKNFKVTYPEDFALAQACLSQLIGCKKGVGNEL